METQEWGGTKAADDCAVRGTRTALAVGWADRDADMGRGHGRVSSFFAGLRQRMQTTQPGRPASQAEARD